MTIEKVKAIAKEKYDKDLTDEQAAAYMEKHGKLSDDELDNVAGGGCMDGHDTDKPCPACGANMRYYGSQYGSEYVCPECGHKGLK